MKNAIQSSFSQFGQIWSILDRFDPYWTDLIHYGQIWSILDRFDPIWWKKEVSFLSSCNLYTQHYILILLNSRSVQSFVIMNCCQLWHLNSMLWFEKPLSSAVFLRHTIKTAVEVRRTAENCGFLNHIKKVRFHKTATFKQK